MIDFLLDDKGDVIIDDNKIKTVSDNDLIAQKVRQVLKTNLGEWWLNEDEGIDFHCILCKNPDFEQIEDNIKNGLLQVDETLELTGFSHSYDNDRTLHISFTAQNDNGTEIEVTI